MTRTFGRMTTLALALSSYTFVTGCDGRKPGGEPRAADATGTVALDLRLPDGRLIASANYTITGPNGFTKTGTINRVAVVDADRHHRRPPRWVRLPDHHHRP